VESSLSFFYPKFERQIVKHAHSHDGDVNVNIKVEVEVPTQKMEDLVSHVAASTIVVIGFYMAADTVRSIIKFSLK